MIFKKRIYKLHKKLIQTQSTLFLAESCTGGYFAKQLTDFSGASQYLIGSIVCYANEIKQKILNVANNTLSQYGAVSNETVREMILGLQNITKSDFQIAITGIAGPGGGELGKPVGTVCIAVSNNSTIVVNRFVLKGNRNVVRKNSIIKAIDMLFDIMES